MADPNRQLRARDLRQRARELGIPGRSKMRKNALARAISAVERPLILALPREMYAEILERGEPEYIARLCVTNRAMARLCSADFDPQWRRRLLRDFVLTRPYDTPEEFGRINKVQTPSWFAVYRELARGGGARGVANPTARDMAAAGFLEGVARVVLGYDGPDRAQLLVLLLWDACGNGHIELMHFLVNEGALFEPPDYQVISGVFFPSCTSNAARNGQAAILNAIYELRVCNGDGRYGNVYAMDPLLAAADNHSDAVVALDQWSPSIVGLMDQLNADDRTPHVWVHRLRLRQASVETYAQLIGRILGEKLDRPAEMLFVATIQEAPPEVRAATDWRAVMRAMLRGNWELALLDLLSQRQIPRDAVLAELQETPVDQRRENRLGWAYVLRHFRLPAAVRERAMAIAPLGTQIPGEHLQLSL